MDTQREKRHVLLSPERSNRQPFSCEACESPGRGRDSARRFSYEPLTTNHFLLHCLPSLRCSVCHKPVATGAGTAEPARMNNSVRAIAAIKFLFHVLTARLYGFFIDELYFLACGQHLAWGYIDMPPLTAFQAWLTRDLCGDSPSSIRLFPALAGAGLVLVAAAIARELGGGKFAQILTALAVLFAPGYLAFCSYP